MAEEVDADDLLRIMVTELRKFVRTARVRGQQIWRLLTKGQRRRSAIERGLNQDRWGPDRERDHQAPRRRGRQVVGGPLAFHLRRRHDLGFSAARE